MTTPILDLDEWTEAQAQPHVTVDLAIRWLECFAALSVQSLSVTTPPVSPVEGDRYIVATGSSGVWTGHDAEIALYFGSAWQFKRAPNGTIAYVEDDGIPYRLLVGSPDIWNPEAPPEAAGQRYDIGASLILAALTQPRITIPVSGTLVRWSLHAEGGPGDAVVDIRRTNAGPSFPPTIFDSITGAAPPTISGDHGATDDCDDFSLTEVDATDILEFVLVSSDTNITALHIQLTIEP